MLGSLVKFILQKGLAFLTKGKAIQSSVISQGTAILNSIYFTEIIMQFISNKMNLDVIYKFGLWLCAQVTDSQSPMARTKSLEISVLMASTRFN